MAADLDLAVRQARTRADTEAGEASVIGRQGKAARAEAARLRESLELHEKVLGVLTSVGEARQESVHRQVEGLVTRALQVIFSEELSFRLVPEVKGNRVEIDFVLRSMYACKWCRGTGRDNDPENQVCVYCNGSGASLVDTPVLDARGGGMAAVVGFVLRLTVLLLTPGARWILFLDESFSHVSAEYEPRVAEFLREVADKAGVQIVLITHSTAYSDLADASYRLKLVDGTTQACEGGIE